ncbi:fluoride efflux transporter FluC [Sutcliffiella cohnii]
MGFFGAFTTFSTFSMELIELIRKKFYKKAILYFSLSIFGSIGFFLIGSIVGK